NRSHQLESSLALLSLFVCASGHVVARLKRCNCVVVPRVLSSWQPSVASLGPGGLTHSNSVFFLTTVRLHFWASRVSMSANKAHRPCHRSHRRSECKSIIKQLISNTSIINFTFGKASQARTQEEEGNKECTKHASF